MRRWTWLVVIVAMSAMALPPPVTAQTSEAVGVVTTLDGRANVARPALTVPLALKFKDDVFGRDRISTQENSLVRVLLGGKAILTVRELSQVTISEEPGRAVVTLPDGKVVLAVAKQRMRPGESIEIRTPNAVASVRGSSMSVSHVAGNTVAICGSGDCTYQFGSGPTNVLPPGQAGKNAQIVQASQDEMRDAFSVPTVVSHTEPDATVTSGIMDAQMDTAASVAYFASGVTPPNFALGTATLNPPGTLPPPPNNPLTGLTKEEIAASSIVTSASASLASLANGGGGGGGTGGGGTGGGGNPGGDGSAGSFPPGWSLSGAGSVISNLGSIGAPAAQPTPKAGAIEKILNGNFGTGMGMIFTGGAAVNNTTSTLTQAFSVDGGTALVVRLKYNFLSNEYPSQDQIFNDTFRVRIVDPGSPSQPALLALESRNTSFTPSTVSPETATAGGFTIFQGNGVTGFKDLSVPFTPTASGQAQLIFDIFDQGDTAVDSAALIDSVSIITDPPLYFLKKGDSLVRTDPEPLLRLNGTPRTFDSLMVVCCDGRATLAGPLLTALDSDLTIAYSLLSVYQGGSLVTSTTEPLVRLEGGNHSIGQIGGVPMFDLWGVNSTADPETGLTLGTDRPLQHAGSLLDTSNAIVSAHQAVRIDTALLEATAPLLSLRNGSKLTTATDAIQLSYQAKVTSLGSLVKLDRSTMIVASGAALNIAGGSLLRVTGDLFSLTNGSTLSVLSGPLVSLGGGSILSVNGALVGFGGTGGNLVSVANNLCPCTAIGGIPVSLSGGALASNVSITGAIKNGNLGSLSLAPNSAVIRVDGVGTKVTINGM